MFRKLETANLFLSWFWEVQLWSSAICSQRTSKNFAKAFLFNKEDIGISCHEWSCMWWVGLRSAHWMTYTVLFVLPASWTLGQQMSRKRALLKICEAVCRVSGRWSASWQPFRWHFDESEKCRLTDVYVLFVRPAAGESGQQMSSTRALLEICEARGKVCRGRSWCVENILVSDGGTR